MRSIYLASQYTSIYVIRRLIKPRDVQSILRRPCCIRFDIDVCTRARAWFINTYRCYVHVRVSVLVNMCVSRTRREEREREIEKEGKIQIETEKEREERKGGGEREREREMHRLRYCCLPITSDNGSISGSGTEIVCLVVRVGETICAHRDGRGQRARRL